MIVLDTLTAQSSGPAKHSPLISYHGNSINMSTGTTQVQLSSGGFLGGRTRDCSSLSQQSHQLPIIVQCHGICPSRHKTCQVTSDRAVSIGAVFTYIQLHGHKQMKLDELVCNSAKQNGSPSQPPICFPLMKTFGTVLWPVHSLRASWSSAPSPKVKKIDSVRVCSPNPMVNNDMQFEI